MRIIDADVLEEFLKSTRRRLSKETDGKDYHTRDLMLLNFEQYVHLHPTLTPESLVKRGRWIYEAHKENANYRWHVTAECSECADDKGEVWAGFFPGVPDSLAKTVALQDAEQAAIGRYCSNCGAKMVED